MAYFLTRWKHRASKIKFKSIEPFFLFIIFFIFLFIGIGKFAGAAALGALLAGMALKNFIPEKKLQIIDSEIRTMAYGFFAPIFFISVGLGTDISYLLKYPLLILGVVLLANVAKIGTCYLLGKKEFGVRGSLILGISLTVKLSTSIVIIKILYDNALIPLGLYSILVGSTIIFCLLPILTLSVLLKRWKNKVKNRKL